MYTQSRPSSANLLDGVVRLGGPAAMLGGTLWLLLWAHFLLTHGPSSSDYKNTFLGLSYYDSTKLVVFALAFCILGLVSLRARLTSHVRTRVGTLGYYLAVIGLAGIIVGVTADVWSIPWGDTTRVSTAMTTYAWGGIAIASLIAFLGLTLLGIGVVRGGLAGVDRRTIDHRRAGCHPLAASYVAWGAHRPWLAHGGVRAVAVSPVA